MAHQIRADQIRPGQNIIVRGQIEYARVRSLMGPEDIDKLNVYIRARRGNEYDRNKPMTRLALHHAEVIPQDPSGQMTPEEYYIWERLFTTDDKPELGVRFSMYNKGNRLPVLLKVVNGQAEQIRDEDIPPSSLSLPTEPAKNQTVTAVLSVYDSKKNYNGIKIQAILFNDEPEWFTGGNSVNNAALAKLGITLSGPIVAQEGTVINEAPVQQTEVAAPVAPVAPTAPVIPAVQQAAPVQVQAPIATPVQQVAAPVAPGVVPTVAQQAAPQNTVVDASGLAMPAPVTQAVAPAAPVVNPVAPVAAQTAPNPLAAQVLGAIAQQQAPAQVQTGSAFGTTPEAQPVAPVASAPATSETTSIDSPWAI